MPVYAVAVVHFLAAVETQNDIAHLAVCKIDDVVVNQNAVCRQREAEVLTAFLFAGTGIRDKLLYDVEIHQRFAAKEVDFQIVARAGMFEQEIKRLLADLKGHESAVAVVLALACKAVGAV